MRIWTEEEPRGEHWSGAVRVRTFGVTWTDECEHDHPRRGAARACARKRARSVGAVAA